MKHALRRMDALQPIYFTTQLYKTNTSNHEEQLRLSLASFPKAKIKGTQTGEKKDIKNETNCTKKLEKQKQCSKSTHYFRYIFIKIFKYSNYK